MEGLSKSRLLMKNEGKLSFRQSQLDDESSSGQVDSMLRCSETSGTMVRNVGTSQSFLQGTSERTNQNMLRRSFDIPSDTLDLYVNDQRSLSDSELEMTTYDVSDMSSEFLDLPTRVSVKPHSSYRHRIDPEKLYLDLKKVKLEQSRHSNANKPSFIDAPKIEFTPVDVVIDTEVAEDNKRSDLYIDNDIDSNYEGDYVSRMSANMWINLDTPSHTLLSPRSSNGSICSYRSSNADSAIELLTPDEEMSEHSPIDLSHTKLWEEKHKPRLGKTHDIWDTTTITGAKLNSKTADTTQEDNSILMCSQPLYRRISSSHCREDSSSALNPLLTLQINSNLANLPSKEESNKGRELSLPCPPSVVISDFSNENSSVNTSQMSSSSPHTSQSQGELLEDPSMFFHRSLSSSSISSTESFLSIQSDSSLDVDEPPEFPIKVAKKQSSWKKIRNIVHWSPFIQQFKRRRYPWIQLAGHQGNFQAGGPGAILKKLDKKEHRSFNKLMNDVLRPYVPEYRGESEKDGDCYIQLQDLLCDFEAPCVMDIKMGCRTYLEEELSKAREKPTLRGDMYKKMIEVDPKEPTEEEHKQKAITKPRYMQWRDDMSSTTEMGFRIEGIRKSDGAQVKNFKTTKDKASVKSCLKQFVEENPEIINKYLRRLKAIRATQEDSPFFKSNEIIGSSLLFVHDRCGQACIWMIDFGKTVPLPESVSVNHRNKWVEGNHEDGYLTGIDSLINIFEELEAEYKELSGNSVPRVEKESVNTARIDSKNDDSENSNKIASNQGSSDNSYKTDSYQGSSDNSNKIVSNHGNRDHSDKSVAGYHSNMEVDHKNNESIV